jgi:hypothetical protein
VVVRLRKDSAAKAEGREIVKGGEVRTVAVKVAEPIEVTTGVVAIGAASRARLKSTSRN